ncbi:MULTISPECIES: FMN-binding protein [Terrabacteria group]|uniref:FMN-binding protein n=1 Tax=Bacillati TaxID=1783272 RepID=UPI001C6EDC41|nr:MULTISPECIES: FMN-binding protein [Terrabacteria group]MBW9212145.1 FMN-binding protein [Trueperella sp. zg.1013]
MKKKEFSSVYKTVLLAVLCAICGFVLSLINALTAPKIAENAIASVKSTLEKIWSGATFSDVSSQYLAKDKTGLITGVYEAKDKGLAFTLKVKGYNADGFTFIVGFNNDGTVAGYSAIEENETKGKGSKAFDSDYVEKMKKLTSKDSVELISGATVTTAGVSDGFNAAKAVFNEAKGIRYDPNAKPKEAEKPKVKALKDSDFSSNEAKCTKKSKGVYACEAKGFEGVSKATITLEGNKVKSVVVDSFGDTEGVGDKATEATELKKYEAATMDSTIDATSGATLSSNALKAMVYKALQEASK